MAATATPRRKLKVFMSFFGFVDRSAVEHARAGGGLTSADIDWTFADNFAGASTHNSGETA
jgi:hypothetical protein